MGKGVRRNGRPAPVRGFIVGHSNTVTQMINAYLGAAIYPAMTEDEHGDLYKVTVLDGAVSHEMTVHN